MNGIARKFSVILVMNLFFMTTIFGSVFSQQNPKNIDFGSKSSCVISVLEDEVITVERDLSQREVLTLEHLLNVLAKVFKVLENPRKGLVEKLIAKIIGERTIVVLKENKFFPNLGKCDEMVHFFGNKRDRRWGIRTRIMGFGQGKVYIPLKISNRGSIRPILKPVFWYYPQNGITLARFGATYSWPGDNSMGYRGWLRGAQSGVMLGFSGIHFTIQHRLRPDTHFFVGHTLGIRGNNFCMKSC